MSDTDEHRAETTVEVMKELAETAGNIVQPGLAKISKLHKLRAKRLTLTAKRLEKGLGSSHPRVVTLRSRAAAAKRMSEALDVERRRNSGRPKPTAKEWMVRGRIYSSSGEPIKGAKVRIYEKEPGADNLIGEVESDKFGDYAITYHERVFAGAPESTDLVIEIIDREGNVLQPGEGDLRFKPGRDENLGIVIDTPIERPVRPPEPEPVRPEPPTPEPPVPIPGDDPIPLSEVPGIGRVYLARLRSARIKDVAALAALDVGRVASVLGVSERIAKKISYEAKRLVA